MSFPVDTPIGILPYAITPTGQVQFLLWRSAHTTPHHSSTLYGHCTGVKDRFDQSMWDVCARTWAEQTGGLYAVSEELRLKREKREKKELKLFPEPPSTAATSTKSKKSDKKDKKNDKKDKKGVGSEGESIGADNDKFYPSIIQYQYLDAIHNTLYETPAMTPAIIPSTENKPQSEPTPVTTTSTTTTLYSPDSKRVKHFQLIYKTFSPAQLIYNSQKMVRKLLTSRQSNVITLTNDNLARPIFVYCIQIEYMPLWMVNYVLKQNGNGDCVWVHAYELTKYLSLDLLNNIPDDYNQKNMDENSSPQRDPALNNELQHFRDHLHHVRGRAQITPQVEHESVIFDSQLWTNLVQQYKPTPPTLEPQQQQIITPTSAIVQDRGRSQDQSATLEDQVTMTGAETTTPNIKTKIIINKGKVKVTKTTEKVESPQQNDGPKKITVPSSHFATTGLQNSTPDNTTEGPLTIAAVSTDPNIQSLTQCSIPLNLILMSVLTIDSLLKLIKMYNTQLTTTQQNRIYQHFTMTNPTPDYIKYYDLPKYLIKYNDDRYNDQYPQPEDGMKQSDQTPGVKKLFMTPSQRQQLALDMQSSSGYYKCRNCRHVLFAACHLLTHTRFDFDQHVEKAHNKHVQQIRAGLQSYRRAVMETKNQLAKVEKFLRKYLLTLRLKGEIDMNEFDDEDDDGDLDDEDYLEDEDDDGDALNNNGDDSDDMFAQARRNKIAFMGETPTYDNNGDDNDTGDEEDGEEAPNRGLTLLDSHYDPGLVMTYKECYDSIRGYIRGDEYDDEDDEDGCFGVDICDDRDYALREQYVGQFMDYQTALGEYHTEKKRLNDDLNRTDGNDNDDQDTLGSLQSALNNLGEEKGTGVYVKPVFGKASTKGFTTKNDNMCQSIFLDGALDNFPPTLVPLTSSEGSIMCQSCNYRCGNYSWSGTQCSCGQWVVPGLQIPLSRIDFAFRDRYQPPTTTSTATSITRPPPQLSQITTSNGQGQQPPEGTPAASPPETKQNSSQQHMPGPQPGQAQPQGGQIIGVRRLPANRPPVKKPSAIPK